MHILLVEDDRRIAYLVDEALRDAGHRVTAVHDGAQGLAVAERDAPDVVVLDLMLPSLDGLEVCRRLRQRGSGVAILMLTARDAVPDRVRGLDAGADDYLVKPFALEELLARLRALERRGGGESESVLRVGELTLDRQRHVAQRGGRTIELTAKEFQLLEYLMRNPGRVLSKEQISNHVWGYAADITANAVETYVHYVRDKVDRGFPRPLLRTIRGVGYALKE